MDYLRFFIVFFVLGTWVLSKLNFRRYFIVFLIKTKRGIVLLDRIARFSPGFWKFMADFAVVLSFGGLGAAYLTKHKQRRNLYVVEILLGFLILFFILLERGLFYAAVFGVFLLGAVISFYKAKSQVIDFSSTAAMLCFIGVKTLSFAGVYVNPVKFLILAGSVFGLPAIVLSGLWMNASGILSNESDVPGITPLLPSSRGGSLGVSFPGYDIFIPWWYALTALIITVVAHEFAHGVLAKANKMRIKSTGLITVGILPIGAFVEPDDAEVKRRPSIQKMRLFSVGSFANLSVCFLAGIFYVFVLFLVAASMKTEGLEIVSTVEGYPAHGVVEPGMVLLEVNGRPVNPGDLFPGVKPEEEVNLTTDRGVIKLKTVQSPDNKSKAYIGIYSRQKVVLKEDFKGRFPVLPSAENAIEFYLKAISFAITSLKWIMFFNFNIALVNLIPIAPFDGWHMLKELLSAFNISEATAQRIAYGILVFTALLFLINLSPLGGKIMSSVI